MKHTAIAQMTVPSQCHMEWNHTVKWTVLTISATPGNWIAGNIVHLQLHRTRQWPWQN